MQEDELSDLSLACYKGDRRKVTSELKAMREWDASLDLMDGNGYSAIFYAVVMGHTKIVSALVAKGADCNVHEANSQIWLIHTAANLGNMEILDELVKGGVRINEVGPHRKTALHVASAHGSGDLVHWFMRNGADARMLDESGKSALHLAVIHQNGPAVTALLEEGVDVDMEDKHGATALMYACHVHNTPDVLPEYFTALFNYDASVDKTDKYGQNALIYTALGEQHSESLLHTLWEYASDEARERYNAYIERNNGAAATGETAPPNRVMEQIIDGEHDLDIHEHGVEWEGQQLFAGGGHASPPRTARFAKDVAEHTYTPENEASRSRLGPTQTTSSSSRSSGTLRSEQPAASMDTVALDDGDVYAEDVDHEDGPAIRGAQAPGDEWLDTWSPTTRLPSEEASGRMMSTDSHEDEANEANLFRLVPGLSHNEDDDESSDDDGPTGRMHVKASDSEADARVKHLQMQLKTQRNTLNIVQGQFQMMQKENARLEAELADSADAPQQTVVLLRDTLLAHQQLGTKKDKEFDVDYDHNDWDDELEERERQRGIVDGDQDSDAGADEEDKVSWDEVHHWVQYRLPQLLGAQSQSEAELAHMRTTQEADLVAAAKSRKQAVDAFNELEEAEARADSLSRQLKQQQERHAEQNRYWEEQVEMLERQLAHERQRLAELTKGKNEDKAEEEDEEDNPWAEDNPWEEEEKEKESTAKEEAKDVQEAREQAEAAQKRVQGLEDALLDWRTQARKATERANGLELDLQRANLTIDSLSSRLELAEDAASSTKQALNATEQELRAQAQELREREREQAKAQTSEQIEASRWEQEYHSAKQALDDMRVQWRGAKEAEARALQQSQEMSDENKSTRRKLQVYKERCGDVEAESGRLRLQVAEAQRGLEKELGARKHLQTQVDVLMRQNLEYQATVDSTKRELADVRMQLFEQSHREKGQVQELQLALDRATAEAESRAARLVDLERSLESAKADAHALKKRCAHAEQAKVQLEMASNAQLMELETMQRRLAAAVEEVEEARQGHHERKERYKAIARKHKDKLVHTEQTLNEMREDVGRMVDLVNTRLATLLVDLGDVDSNSTSQSPQENARYFGMVLEHVRTELTIMNQELSGLVHMEGLTTGKVQWTGTGAEQSKQMVERLRADYEHDRVSLESQRRSLMADLSQVEAERDQLQKKLRQARARCDEAESSVSMLQRQLDMTMLNASEKNETIVQTLRKELEESQRIRQEQRLLLDDMLFRNNELRDQLAHMQRSQDEQGEEQREHARTQASLKLLQSQHVDLERQTKQLELENVRLQRQLAASQQQLNTAAKQVQPRHMDQPPREQAQAHDTDSVSLEKHTRIVKRLRMEADEYKQRVEALRTQLNQSRRARDELQDRTEQLYAQLQQAELDKEAQVEAVRSEVLAAR